MRQANWDEIFQRESDGQFPAAADSERAAPPWKDGLTFLLTFVACMSVAASVDTSNWVRGLPWLYPIAFSALIIAYGLSRIRWNQLGLLPVGLLAGATIVFLQLMAIIPGHSLYVRTDHLIDRMYVWWSATTQHGTSLDPLPVITIILALTWLGSFISAWAIFRWRNPILGLIPGSAALIWDTAFSTSQINIPAVVYLITAVLLFMRLRVARQERQWDRTSVAYPEFISLSVLNATFWVTCALLGAVFVIPLGDKSGVANARWDQFTSPFTSHLTPIARVFLSINPNKGAKIHSLKDALALQGKINPSAVPAVQIEGDLPANVAPFLREQSFDQYTRDGWRVNVKTDVPLGAGDSTRADGTGKISPPGAANPQSRTTETLKVTVEGGNADHLFSLGQPLQADTAASAGIGGDPSDVTSLKPAEHLSNGDQYTVTGSVSAASIDQLRAAGTQYPAWVTQSYLQLSRRLPDRVRDKAREVAAGTDNPYDAAAAIEDYLRTFPIDYSVPAAPPRVDNVDYFLFDAQRGYFDYHASAMAVMLRTLGIPSRVATGYVIDPRQRQGGSDTFKLTQQQAFAWPEVYFPGTGWVEFNPTPSQPEVNRPQTALAPAADAQPAAGQPARVPPAIPLSPAAPAGTSGGGGLGATGWLVIALAAAASIVVAAAAAGTFAWEFAVRGLAPPARLWEKTVRLATLGRTVPETHETPREFAERLKLTVPDADGVVYIASTYERERFGQKALSPDESKRLKAAWTSTRFALLRRVLRLKSRAVVAQDDVDGSVGSGAS